jgi:SAM-dependent methyltransferase
MSISYYDRNGATFFARTVNADMSADHGRFLKNVKYGGSILEAGCGSGRDALAFKNAGYAVTAMDGSEQMVRLATAHAGLPVLHKRFDEIEWQEAFDAIWANASLLHVPRAELPFIMARLTRALKTGGVLYMSFKYGDHDGFARERHFTHMTEPLLGEAIRDQGLEHVDMWASGDVRAGRNGEIWLSAIARKP